MTDDVRCPICGSETTIRTAKKGAGAGEKFHVCNRYPECKGKVYLGMTEADATILRECLDKGTPCIPFIPVDALGQSQSIAKPEQLTGYYIVRIPTLYPDGSIKYLYKEEFMLLQSVVGLASSRVKKGRIDSFFGLELPMKTDVPKEEYLLPKIFYQNSLSLFRVDFQEDIKFGRQMHAPSLEVALIPKNRNLKVKNLYVINFFEVTQILLNDKEKPTSVIGDYEGWNAFKLPSSGPELQEMFNHYKESLREKLDKRQ